MVVNISILQATVQLLRVQKLISCARMQHMHNGRLKTPYEEQTMQALLSFVKCLAFSLFKWGRNESALTPRLELSQYCMPRCISEVVPSGA